MDTYISPVSIPYTGNIPGGVLRKDLKIEINGSLPHHSNGFAVNLCQGPKLDPNTLLHFNPRFNENCIVINSMQNNGWGGEERTHGMQGLEKGKTFDLRIEVESEGFEIKVNGHKAAHFRYRFSKETIGFLIINGDVTVNSIKYDVDGGGFNPYGSSGYPTAAASTYPGAGGYPGGYPSGPTPMAGGYPGVYPGAPAPAPFAGGYPGSYPQAPAPGGYNPSQQQASLNQPICNPPVPYKVAIPGGMTVGRMIAISGVPNANSTRFTINLQSGDDSIIAFHCDVRFHFGSAVNVIVRNHCHRGQWGSEESQAPTFPFAPNANFDIYILNDQQCFKVAVNNQHLLEFRHRLPFQDANTLSISGDVRLTQVRFQ